MSSKPVEPARHEDGRRPRSRESRPAAGAGSSSITWRLTLLYAVSTAALLLLLAGLLDWTLRESLDHTRQGLLASKIEVLRLLLREQADRPEVLASEVTHEASESQPLRYYVRVLDEQNATAIETPDMGTLAPPEWFPVPLGAEINARPGEIAQRLRRRDSLLLFAAKAAVGPAGREQRTLQIAMDVSAALPLLAEYRQRAGLVLAAGILVAAVTGAWVARRSLRPLTEITQTAQHITASQLHDRIGTARWPRELAELAAAFDAMLDRLEDSFTRLSQFSADLAHALRTPIHNLRGEAEVTLARARTPEEYRHVLASSLEECDRLARMIDGLLFLARADDPKVAVQRTRFDARSQIEAVRDFYEALANELEVEVTCAGQAWLTGDPMLFRRAVSNLLGNALRHTPAHGTVRITLRTLENQGVEVEVRDTGCGIAPEHLPKIFDRFYRAGQSQSPVPGGIGLGLAIVQSIMLLHGGSARVASELGRGTAVLLTFPQAASGGALSPEMTKL